MSSTNGVTFVGAVDPAGDQTGTLDETLIFDSVNELIEQNINMAVVACPTVTHETVALELCEAGIHTLVEKPLAMDIAAAERITVAFEKANLVGAVGHIESICASDR